MEQHCIYEFDDFRVDAGKRLLQRGDGSAVHLTPKAFDTLVYLLQHTRTVLSKETLMRAIWADASVEENNLNQCISALRRALGEKRADHRYVVTVPGRGYRFVARVNTRTPDAVADEEDSIPSIAVLPFQPLDRNHRDEALEMGMADTLIARLSGLRNIVVRPLSSVRRYADSYVDVLDSGRELGVDSVLEGSLQRQGNRVRATVRLLKVSNGISLWSGTFNNEMTDIFALQDTIAEQVTQALSLELSKEDKSRLVKHYTKSPTAYQLYLKGRYYWWKNTPEEYKKSRDYFHRAVEEDPSFALGYCGLNSFYGFGAAWGMIPPEDGWPKAEWAVTKALELDEQLAEAHLDLAALKMVYRLDWASAENEMKRALELAPGFDEIHYAYSFFLMVMRRFPEAIAEAKRAVTCNPFSLRLSQHLGHVFYCSRSYDEAIDQYRKALELDAADVGLYEVLGDAYEQRGDYRQAAEHWTKAMHLTNDKELVATFATTNTRNSFESGVRKVASQKLGRLQRNRDSGHYVPSIQFARTHLRAGDCEEAIQWLTRACEERNVYSLMIACDPFYDPLRADPRFTHLVRRMKLD